MRAIRLVPCVVTGLLLSMSAAFAAEWGLKEGTPEIKSAGALAFGPDGILFVGDAKGATVFAIGTGDTKGDPSKVQLNVSGLNAKVAETLGVNADKITINDLAVNPLTGNVFLSVSKAGSPAVVKVANDGKLSQVGLAKVAFQKVELPNAPEDKEVATKRGPANLRNQSITDLAYAEGKVYVSGVAGGSPSNVREIPFPFTDANAGTSVEIYHGAHGRLEDNAVVRTFLPINIDGEASLLAGFTCTPLVKFPVNTLKPGEKTRGTTVAELGNRNQPLDLIVYKKDGKDFLLMSNSARGVMKISTDGITKNPGITAPVTGGGVAGQTYETIKELEGVVQLDKLNATHAVIVTNAFELRTIALP
ncbi:MAG: hypothetical protein FJ302_06290 [Planctomycetes bacterium]|nr:hypothetical protein [Planctomycetota bacterium]